MNETHPDNSACPLEIAGERCNGRVRSMPSNKLHPSWRNIRMSLWSSRSMFFIIKGSSHENNL